jgi:predicted ArsR family transcriptional regulator
LHESWTQRIRLIGLLRSDGPMTATQAAAPFDDNAPNCSFHLRQLAKYGFVERIPGRAGTVLAGHTLRSYPAASRRG